MMTDGEFDEQMKKLYTVIPKLEKNGPIRVPDPANPSRMIVLTAANAKQMLDFMRAQVDANRAIKKAAEAFESIDDELMSDAGRTSNEWDQSIN